MLGVVYFGGTIPSESDTAIKVSTSAGTIVGQLGFGALADIVGRKKMVRIPPALSHLPTPSINTHEMKGPC